MDEHTTPGRLDWATALPVPAERHHVLIVYHRGHGRGPRTRHFRLGECADDAVALAHQLGVESLVALGYSMGGRSQSRAGAATPDRVRGLVLCATARHFLRPEAMGVVSAVLPGAVVAARVAPVFFRDQMIARMLARGGTPLGPPAPGTSASSAVRRR